MAINDNKKYFWLKLDKNFFKRHDIKIIEGMPNGKDYILFYLKLLCESISHEGNLRFSDTIPYNESMLATITNTNVDIVRSAIKVFTDLHMMIILDDGTIFMNEVTKMIGSETGQTIRKREAKALLGYDGGKVGVKNTLELEKEIEKEKEIDKDIELEKDNNKRPPKKKYGDYSNVLLTDEEYNKLHQDYANASELITYLDEYIEMKGYKAKSHYLAIKKWVVEAVEERKRKHKGTQQEQATSNPFIQALIEGEK